MLGHYRALSRTIIPRDLHNQREQLENYELTRRLYKGYAVSTDNKIALIFTDKFLLDLLSKACKIFCQILSFYAKMRRTSIILSIFENE